MFFSNVLELSCLQRNLAYPSGYLRNVVISVSMPSDIEEYKKFIDNGFGFQQLNCQSPSALFRIDTLTSRFLGNNGRSGTIPQQKAVYPKNMNLAASNFIFDSSNICILPGLNCLLRNFPCSKNAPCCNQQIQHTCSKC
ncbi:probable LRR receptor-like serine/threonine-protein kinase At1g56130 isoform X2 [Mangifera indica]|uniref:probable LRR receptor-like serine/threonine-protein kinase At1g56130 isoform X2 n=1 Tax=Mangifera indica TaxID=29780 RepID=UPI001CFAF9DB|nr:probable LRR receptor-like serine/threonine-protein kinase At1g56130 isoform X2 [Mangifera indica]